MYVLEEKEKYARLNIISLILIIAGIFFSQFFIFRFNVAFGFTFDSVKIYHLFPLIKYRNGNHDSIMITTSIIGYLSFFSFLIINYRKVKELRPNLGFIAIFLNAFAILHELKIYYQALTDSFTNDPVFVGWPLLLMCAVIYTTVLTKK